MEVQSKLITIEPKLKVKGFNIENLGIVALTKEDLQIRHRINRLYLPRSIKICHRIIRNGPTELLENRKRFLVTQNDVCDRSQGEALVPRLMYCLEMG